MFAYCDNNPVNGHDPTGHSWKSFWSKVGSSIASAASGFVKAVSKVFGAKASVVNQYTNSDSLDYGGVRVTKGRTTAVTSSSVGTTSSSYYVYAEGRSDNIFMSSVGAGRNIGNFSMNASIGLDEFGTEFSYSNGNSTTSLGLIADFSSAQIGVQYGITTEASPLIEETEFVFVSVDLLLAATVAVCIYTGIPIIGTTSVFAVA